MRAQSTSAISRREASAAGCSCSSKLLEKSLVPFFEGVLNIYTVDRTVRDAPARSS